MPYIRLGKEREARHGRSEQFKRAVLVYFQSRGYSLDKDSLIEGTFEDQVYFTKTGIRVNVECKDTDVSPTSKSFLIPFGIYLARYANTPPEDRFSFVFCARSFKNQGCLELVFGNVRDNDAATKLVEKAVVTLEQEGKPDALRAAKILQSLDENIIHSFIENAEIIEGDNTDLERAASEWEFSRGSAFLTSLSSTYERIKSFEQTAKPDEHLETLASNIFRVISLPETIYFARTRYRSRKTLLEKLSYDAHPFLLKEKHIYTFSNLENNNNLLADVITGSISSGLSNDVFSGASRQLWYTDLLNRSINEMLYNRGLRRRTDRFVFVSYDGEQVRTRWNPGTGQVSRSFTRCKIREDGSIAYCVHKAIKAYFKKMGEKYFLVLEPCFYFSVDGNVPMSPLRTTRFSSRAWAYHGNKKLLYDIRFWTNFLSRGLGRLTIQTGGEPVVVDTLYETIQVPYGIEDDKLSNEFLLSPIQFPMSNVYKATPSFQSEIGDFVELEEMEFIVSSELEESEDEWD